MNGERRDDLEVEALITDRYIDALLSARDRHVEQPVTPTEPREEVRDATHRLAGELPRIHPSFRFGERLASQLQGQAAQLRAGADRRPMAIHQLASTSAAAAQQPSPDSRRDLSQARRPLLIGGALTSAALSIAGAYVAWRRGRPLDPMTRAVRAAHRRGFARRLPARGSEALLRRSGARSR